MPYAYTPRSPPYPPPEDKDWDTEGVPKLVDIDKDPNTVTVVPADHQNEDQDFFKDLGRQSELKQKYNSEIKQAPWTPQTASDNHTDNPLMKIGDLIPKATPVYEGFWKNSDVDILSRLDAASEELKAKRRNDQKETPEESTPEEQNKIDMEDPPPWQASVTIHTDEYSRWLKRQPERHHIQCPSGADDTSDRPTQGDTPLLLIVNMIS